MSFEFYPVNPYREDVRHSIALVDNYCEVYRLNPYSRLLLISICLCNYPHSQSMRVFLFLIQFLVSPPFLINAFVGHSVPYGFIDFSTHFLSFHISWSNNHFLFSSDHVFD